MIKFRIKKVNTKKDLQEALKIREIVFIKGQNVPVKRERDGLEHKCVHFLVLYKNRYIGTGRAFLLNKKEAKFERMAVLKEYRGKGIGLRILKHMVSYCRRNGFKNISLSAQLHSLGFYNKVGFSAEGRMYMDAKIRHKKMVMYL